MKIELKEVEVKKNRISEFEDGGIGIIRKWDHEEKIGKIVVRHRNFMYILEELIYKNEPTWEDFKRLEELNLELYIEPLKPGTQIIITI